MTCEHKSFVYIIQGHKMFLRRWADEQIMWVGGQSGIIFLICIACI